MPQKVIVSVIGPDRPGIIAAVTRILYERDCNIENISQTILQTEFSGTFIAAVPDELVCDPLTRILQDGLTPLGQQVHVKCLAPDAAAPVPEESEPFVITTRGPDRKGLVAGITAVIAEHGVNVTNLQAVFKGGDAPGDNIMIYEVDVPEAIDDRRFHQDLRARAGQLGLQISLQHRNIFYALNRI